MQNVRQNPEETPEVAEHYRRERVRGKVRLCGRCKEGRHRFRAEDAISRAVQHHGEFHYGKNRTKRNRSSLWTQVICQDFQTTRLISCKTSPTHFRIREYRSIIRRNLFTINVCLAQMFEVWQSTYTNVHFISVDVLSQHEGSFDLAEFKVRCVNIENFNDSFGLFSAQS